MHTSQQALTEGNESSVASPSLHGARGSASLLKLKAGELLEGVPASPLTTTPPTPSNTPHRAHDNTISPAITKFSVMDSFQNPKSDWCRPLNALQRQKNSARAAYTPYTVAAADAVAVQQVELVAQQLFPPIQMIEYSSSKPCRLESEAQRHLLLPPLSNRPAALPPSLTTPTSTLPAAAAGSATEDAGSMGTPRQSLKKSSNVLQPLPATVGLSVSNANPLPQALARNSNNQTTTSIPGFIVGASAKQELIALHPCISSTAAFPDVSPLQRRLGSAVAAKAAAAAASTSSRPNSIILTKTALTGLSDKGDAHAIAGHYAHLAHLLHGYCDDDIVVTTDTVSTATVAMKKGTNADEKALTLPPSLSKTPFRTLDTAAQRRYGAAAGIATAKTVPPTPIQTPLLSSEGSTVTTSGDGFRHFIAQYPFASLRGSSMMRADVTRFQFHLQRYFDRQLRGLQQYEESERAQLQLIAFRALQTLMGLHDRYCEYKALRARQAAALEVMQASKVALRDVYPGPMALSPLRAFEEEPEHPFKKVVFRPPADLFEAFEELEASAGTSLKALGTRPSVEELEADFSATQPMDVDDATLREEFEELIPTSDFDLLEESVSTCAKVAPPLEAFEELTAGANTGADIAMLQEQFDELVPQLKAKESEIATAVISEAELIDESQSDGNRSREGMSLHEAFEELVDPLASEEVDDNFAGLQRDDVLQPFVPFEELEIAADTRAKALPPSEPFKELCAHRDIEAEIVELQEVFENLSLLLCYVKLDTSMVHSLSTPLPAALNPFEELEEDEDTGIANTGLQEVFEELLPRLLAEEEESPVPTSEFGGAPEPYEELEESAATHARVPPPCEPFTELEASTSTEERVAALRERFEELNVREPFQQLEPDVETYIAAVIAAQLDPFEELKEASDIEMEEAVVQEQYEELMVPPDVCSGTKRLDERAKEPFEELREKYKFCVETFEELGESVGTAANAAALKEVFEELVPLVQHAERYVGVELTNDAATPTPVTEQLMENEPQEEPNEKYAERVEEEMPVGAAENATLTDTTEAAEARPFFPLKSAPSTVAENVHAVLKDYYVGAPEVDAGAEEGMVQRVTCTFNDLTLDGFAATDIGDVFAEACGVRRPIVVSCERHLAGTNWCVHLLNSGVAIRDCIVADVCAALECVAVRVRNVTLIATAASGTTNIDDAADERFFHDNESVAAGNLGAGLTVRFDVVHEAVFALHPQDEVQYLMWECKFPFLQQWVRSRTALLCLERRRRSSTSSAAAMPVLPAGDAAASSKGTALQLWAYATEVPHRVHKNAPKLPSARLSFSPGFQNTARPVLNGLSNQGSENAGEAVTGALAMAAGEEGNESAHVHLTTPQRLLSPQPVTHILANELREPVCPAEANNDSVPATEADSVDASAQDANSFPRPAIQRESKQPKRKSFFSWKRKGS